MKCLLNLFLILSISINLCIAQNKRKVACIGDSVTKGYGLKDGKSYPDQLQQLLGNQYEVKNFGRNGATLLSKGHNPYIVSEEYKQAIAYQADIVIISLGLNDTDPRNWPNYNLSFKSDYHQLIQSFKDKNPNVEVYICKLTPIFSGHHRFLSGTRDWYDQVQLAIEDIAKSSNVKLIDNNKNLAYRIDLFEDNLHPDERGAEIIANNVYHSISSFKQELKIHESLGSNMVLQRNVINKIHGLASSNEKIQLTFNGKQLETTSSQTGEWLIELPSQKASGPFNISINGEKDQIELTDIYFGDVFLASGQSNMAFQLQYANNSKDLIENAGKQGIIRIFKNQTLVETNNVNWDNVSLEKVNELEYFSGNWEIPNPQNTPNFSAIAYSFALEISQSQNIPVGIIDLSVGGTNTESWISRHALEHDNLLASYIHNWRNSDFIQAFCKERAGVNLKLSKKKYQRHPYEPSYNYESGFSKWLNTNLKAILWYQGESNAHNVEHHEYLFKKLVSSWRTEFNQSLPFYFVQLSSINRPSWPQFRESQLKLEQELPNVHMAISSDLGDSLDVHPKEKLIIGKRLANLVRATEYKEKLIASTPLVEKTTHSNSNNIIIYFKRTSALKTHQNQAIRGFQGIDEFGNIITLEHVRIKGNKILINANIPLKRILYAYEPFTRANLENEQGVPVSTFSISLSK